MKRTLATGRRAWVYLDSRRRFTSVVWGRKRQFGRWDMWDVLAGVCAFDSNCYLKVMTSGLRQDRHGELTLVSERGAAVKRLLTGDVVYAFYSRESNLIKIGRTTDLRRRWVKLENEAGQLRQLVSVWQCPDSRELEHELHQRWIVHRTFGEWFAADAVLDDLRRRYVAAKPQLATR